VNPLRNSDFVDVIHESIQTNPGSGKTSLLRCLNHLWDCSEGSIHYVNLTLDEVMFIPQSPHFIKGCLGDQIAYPDENNEPETNEGIFLSLLHEVGLSYVVEALGVTEHPLHSIQNWQARLSSGEKQRLIFCRILYHRPKLVFLDESTSSLDTESTLHLYGLLRHRVINYVSISHQTCLGQFHDVHLDLEEFVSHCFPLRNELS
jgi:ABC-type uncharacterized transport system fused permease/ATPase subunit